MAYQVIARKYRPQRFRDVVGQEHVTQTLAHAIAQKRIAHAYLFAGPRGTGKTTIARIFAKCLNATNGPTVDFADDDPRCLEIAEGRALDLLEIDAASNRGIDEIRSLRETVKYAPAAARFKIYLIDEVHMLTKEAFNALLKTLEEPPEHVKFLFATTEPEKVLPTILSRCQRFDLRRIPATLIVRHLAWIAEREQVQIEPAALRAIARGAEGAMRDAESALEQLISFCEGRIQEADVLSMFGLTAHGQLVDLAGALIQGQIEAALRQLDLIVRHGKDLARLLADLLGHFRNLLLYQITQGDPALLEVSEAELAALRQQADQISADAVTRIMEVLAEAEGRLRDATSKQILLEVTLLKAIEARAAVSLDEVLKTLRQLRDSGPAAANGGPAIADAASGLAPASPPPASAPPPSVAKRPATRGGGQSPTASGSEAAALAGPPAPAAADLDALWSRLVEAVGRASPFIKSYLLKARPVSLAQNVLTIGFDPEFADQLELADHARHRELLQTKLRELGHPNVLVKFIQTRGSPAGAAPSPAAAVLAETRAAAAPTAAPSDARPPTRAAPAVLTQADLQNDPLIQKALEIFRGRIVRAQP